MWTIVDGYLGITYMIRFLYMFEIFHNNVFKNLIYQLTQISIL